MTATFHDSTGARGRRCRLTARRHRTSTQPIKAAQIVHPHKFLAAPPASRARPPHRIPHGTRSQGPPLQHVAALALANILADTHTTRDSTMPHHLALHGNAFNLDTGQIAEYRELGQCSNGAFWQASKNADEMGRLAQGYSSIKGTNTMFYIRVLDIPCGRKATYLCDNLAFLPEKDNPRLVHWTCGGNKVDYLFNVSTNTADLTTAKLLINSVLSTKNAKFLTTDMKDFISGRLWTVMNTCALPLL